MKAKTALLLVLATTALVSLSRASAVRAMFFDDYESQHAAMQGLLNEQARERASTGAHLVKFGMENDSCGFHIVEPPRNVSFNSSNLYGARRTKWSWWGVMPAYPDPTALSIPDIPSTVIASTRRVFPNAVASLAKVHVNGGWNITATFSERGMKIVSAIHGPKDSGLDFTDWYGERHIGGGNASRMDTTLVFDGIALLSFSVTDLVGLNGPQTVLVAEGLSQSEADKIIYLFENS